MIFITVGTHSSSFQRLLEKMDQFIIDRQIQEPIVAQIGHTTYVPRSYEHFTFCTREDFQKLIAQATAVVTHGGIGTILPAVRIGKLVIAVPRLSRFGEHNNDHQRDICLSLSGMGLIHTTEVLDEIPALLRTRLRPTTRLPLQGTLANAIAERLRVQAAIEAGKEGRLLEPVDLVAILAGDKPVRHKLAMELLREQPTTFVTVTGQREEIDLSISPDRVLPCKPTRTTYEDSQAIRALAEEKGFRSIAVVTSKPHRNRATLTFKRAFADSPVRVQVVCGDEGKGSGNSRQAIEYARELGKTLYYRFKGRL